MDVNFLPPSIPIEVIFAVVEYLSIRDVVNVYLSNTRLLPLLQSKLFDTDNVDETIGVCCELGEDSLLTRSAMFGGNPSLAAVRNPQNEKHRASSLVLAVRFRQDKTFRLLLSLGAKMDTFGPKKAIRLSRALLARKDEPGLLNEYIESNQRYIISLSEAILGDASMHTIQLLLNHGANPNSLLKMAGPTYTSPLSAAIMTINTEAFDLLAIHGAEVEGPQLFFTGEAPSVPIHIPVFAAARTMRENGIIMMQKCIDLGAVVDNHWPMVTPGAGPEMAQTVTAVSTLPPVQVFLGTFPAEGLTMEEHEVMCAGLDLLIKYGAVF